MQNLRKEYLSGKKGVAPAAPYLGKTRSVYEFVRVTLGIKMQGSENLHVFEAGPGVEEVTIGQNISLIHEVCFTFETWRFLLTCFLSCRLYAMARCNLLC